MKTSRLIPFAVAGLLAATQMPLHAQDASRPAVQLAFGYECGDRFMVRNDGDQPVVVEYGVAGSEDRSQLHLNARQSAEIASAQAGNMELRVHGKVVASEPKGNRACGAVQSNGSVSVRPLDQNDNAVASPDAQATTAAPVVVYPSPYDYYDYYPYDYPYVGYYPYYGFSIYGRAPLGHGFGHVGGIGRGRAGGRGRR